MSHFPRKPTILWPRLGCAVGVLGVTQLLSAADEPQGGSTFFSDSEPIELKLGPVEFEPKAATSLTYDDNILFSSHNRQSDLIWDVNPGFQAVAGDKLSLLVARDAGADVMLIGPDTLVGLSPEGLPGSFLIMDETPLFETYSEHSQNNYIGNTARINALVSKTKFVFGASFSYIDSPITVVEAGQRTGAQTYNGIISGSYFISQNTSTDTILSYTKQAYQEAGLIGSTKWQDQTFLNYQFSPLINGGAGLTLGLDESNGGQSQKYGQLLVRGRYLLAEKITVFASAGGELREYSDGRPNSISTVFNLNANYHLAVRTTLSANASRSTSAATFQGYNYTTTAMDLTLNQGITDRLSCRVTGGYSLYEPNSTGVAASSVAGGKQDFLYDRLSLNMKIGHQLHCSAFYTYRAVLAQSAGDIFGTQVGIELSWQL